MTPFLILALLFADAEIIPIKWAFNRVSKKPLTIGTFRVTDYRRGWTRTSHGEAAAAVPGMTSSREKRRYSYKLDSWDCRCEARAGVDGVISSEETLDCTFTEPQSGAEWKLEMKASGDSTMLSGDLMSGEEAILFRPTTAKVGPLTVPSGYTISSDRKPLGELDIRSRRPTLRLAPTLPPSHRPPVAAATAAILLR